MIVSKFVCGWIKNNMFLITVQNRRNCNWYSLPCIIKCFWFNFFPVIRVSFKYRSCLSSYSAHSLSITSGLEPTDQNRWHAKNTCQIIFFIYFSVGLVCWIHCSIRSAKRFLQVLHQVHLSTLSLWSLPCQTLMLLYLCFTGYFFLWCLNKTQNKVPFTLFYFKFLPLVISFSSNFQLPIAPNITNIIILL